MATAVMSLPNLLAPFHALWAWATREQPAPPQTVRVRPGARPMKSPPPQPRIMRAARRPAALRVVRVVEGGQARGGAGRMVISGRLADVCAELDRLAAREAEGR